MGNRFVRTVACGVMSLERIYNLGTPDNHPLNPRQEAVNRVAVVAGIVSQHESSF